MATQLQTSRRFVGLDTYKTPGDLSGEYVTQADNVFVEGGEFVVRPGLQGQVLTPFGVPAYAPFAYVKADGTTETTFTAAGKLFRLPKGGNTPQEVFNQTPAGQASFALNSASCFAERLGLYEYRVDGSGPLIRHSLTGGAAVTALNNPVAAPAAALTSQVLDDFSAGFVPETLSGAGPANRLSNGDFTQGFSGWTMIGLSPDLYGDGQQYQPHSPFTTSGVYCLVDDPLEGVQSPALVNDSVSGSSTRKARAFYVRASYVQGDKTGNAGIRLSVTVYASANGSGQPLATKYAEFYPSYAGQSAIQFIDAVLTFPQLEAEIGSYTVAFTGGSHNAQLGGDSPYFTNLIAYPVAIPLSLSAALSGLNINLNAPTNAYYGAVGGGRIVKDLGQTTDYSKYQVLSLGLGRALDLAKAGLSLAFGFQQDPATDPTGTVYFSNPCAISADGTYAGVDITTVPLAVRSAFRYFSVMFIADTSYTSAKVPLLQVGPLTNAGNLPIGYGDVSYVFEEVNENGDAALINVIESGSSPASRALTPTLQQATGSVVLPPKINPLATRFNVYRYGGTYSDGYARLVGSYRYDGSAGNEAANPYLSFSSASRTLTDNTPDSFLFTAATLITGRVLPPVGAQAIASWQGRLWLAKGSSLYASWLLAAGQQDALYFSAVNIADDPQAAIKGATFSLGAADNDPIQALIPYGTTLIVLKQRSVWMVFGYDPSNFAAQSYLLRAGVGCLAPRAACVVGNHVWFLSADGVYSFNADIVDPKSVELTKSLNPHGDDGSTKITPAAYAQAAMVYHNRRLLLFAPTPGDTANTAAYVWDSRTGGWTRYLGMTMTGAASLHGGADGLDLVMTGYNGQVYQFAGAADVPVPGAAGTAIPWVVKTRGMGQESEEYGYWREGAAKYAFFFLTTAAQATATVRVEGDDPSLAWTKRYQCAPGATSPRLHVNSRVRGNLIFMTISGQATSRTALRSIALISNEGRTQQ